jgi:hypothetical protein
VLSGPLARRRTAENVRMAILAEGESAKLVFANIRKQFADVSN